MQLGFGDGWISPKIGQNTTLERLSAEVKWYRLEKLLVRLRSDGPGRPPKQALMMLKALLLQQWYGLSDADLEETLNDRMSFRRFAGLGLEEAAPDHTTLCRFRNQLAEEGLSEKLFSEFSRQLEARGLILKRGTMIDASLVETPHRPGSADGERQAVDPDAALTARKGKPGTHYGYKMHAGVDQESRLIRRIVLTPANVNDTVPADALVCGDEKAVYADKGYENKHRRKALKSRGIKDRIMHRSHKNQAALPHWQSVRNRLISSRRAAVEGVFGTLKRTYGRARSRFCGLKATAGDLIRALTIYNLKRATTLIAS